MEKRIQLEMRGKKAAQITKLVLDSCRSTSIVGLTDEFTNLKSLSASDVGLTSLKGFPKLPNLLKLELSDNRISGGLNILASNCPKLVNLNLSANKIATLEVVEPLKELKELEALDLSQCEVSCLDNYREKVFASLPSLKFLDGFDKDEKIAYQSDEEEHENGKKPGKLQVDGSSDLDEEEEEDDFDEEDEDLDGDLDEEEEGEVNLSYLEKENIDEDSEGEDYSPEEDDDEEVEEEDDEEGGEDNAAAPKGQKRKLDDSQD